MLFTPLSLRPTTVSEVYTLLGSKEGNIQQMKGKREREGGSLEEWEGLLVAVLSPQLIFSSQVTSCFH